MNEDLLDQVAGALTGVYELVDEIGRGGHATVFRARDVKHDRTVAIKVLHPDLGNAVGAKRFLREIRIAAKLQHPHILPLYDSGEAEGLLYYVMPYIEGPTLRDRLLDEVQLPIEESLSIARQVGSALAYAQRQGVVHRDIKPENVLLTDNFAILADFGIARALTVAADGDGLTEKGLAVGTPAYMSPEQIKGDRKVDTRGDIYALGCVLYEMLAGEPPFTGPTAQVVMSRHAVDPVRPLRTARSTVSDSIETVIEKALQKVPADRYQTADQFVQALDTGEHLVPTPVATPAPAEPTRELGFLEELKRRRVWRTVVIYAVVGVGAFDAVEGIVPTLGLPGWVAERLRLLIVLGFPLAVVLSWAYEFREGRLRRSTPSGLGALPEEVTRTAMHRRRLRLGGLAALGLVLLVGSYPWVDRVRIPIQLSPTAAQAVAEDFMVGKGAGVGFKTGRESRAASSMVTYFEKVQGIEAGRATVVAEPTTWVWRFRWFRPGEPEDWKVDVGHDGQVTFFQHGMVETTEGADLEPDSARAVAVAFLRTLGWIGSDLNEVAASSQQRAARTDHSFTWEYDRSRIAWKPEDPAAEEGVLRLSVVVAGDEVGEYERAYRVPEDFQQEVLSTGEDLDAFLFVLIVALFAVAAVVAVIRTRDTKVSWRPAFTTAGVGMVAGVTAALIMTSGRYTVDPLDSMFSIWIAALGTGILLVVIGGALGLALAAGTEYYLRRTFPSLLEGYLDVTSGAVRSLAVAQGVTAGMVLGLILAGYEQATVVLAAEVPGIWSALGVSAPLGAVYALPWTEPVAAAVLVSLIAGLTLALAVAVLRHHLNHTGVAVMVPVFIVGGLAADPHPMYVGGLVVAGSVLIMTLSLIRFGLLALLVGLYVDVLLPEAAKYLRWSEPRYVLSGILVLVAAALPILPVLLRWRTKGTDPAREPALS